MNRFLSSINCLFEYMRVFNCNANVLLFSITTVLAVVVLCLTTWWLQNCSRIKLCYFFGLSTLYESLRLILFGLKLVTDKTNFDLAVMSLCRKCTVRITRHRTYIYIYMACWKVRYRNAEKRVLKLVFVSHCTSFKPAKLQVSTISD